ncbi:MAG: ABC transporter ATP-binding protein [Methanomassiliicoccus sp.]|nr:ABC transporter ATP-binding protein [Methanomassiliicoccus sp.]
MGDPIVIDRLTKDFDGFRAVDDLSLTVRQGSFLGFLGPNGAGKTTTIKIMTNLLAASGGSAVLNGIDVVQHPKEALAQVGAVVETPEFYPYLTPNETLAYLGEIRGMTREDISRRTKEVLETVKMTEWADKRIGKFSKGMKQRVAIAQAMLHEPSVIILDEPTSGLDPRGMYEVREILNELSKHDYTIFMSSHLLNEVQEVCSDVALINRGRLLRSGSVEELLEQASVKRIEVRTKQQMSGELLNSISKLEGVQELRASGENQFMFSLTGKDEEQAQMLLRLQSLGLNVVSYKESGLALESLYMSLIKDSR